MSETPQDNARTAYDREYIGFSAAGFAMFKRGYDAAVEDLRRSTESRERVEKALGEAHGVIDTLYAERITSERFFFPSKHHTWPVVVRVSRVLEEARSSLRAIHEEGTP